MYPQILHHGANDGVTGLVAENHHALGLRPALDVQHLVPLELHEPPVGQVEGDGQPGDSGRREPLVGEPEVRPDAKLPQLDFGQYATDAGLEPGPLDAQIQVPDPQLQQPLVRVAGPGAAGPDRPPPTACSTGPRSWPSWRNRPPSSSR